jgi:uncharacterized protein YbjT (DUF2867 family)
MAPKRVTVFGGSGFLGRQIVKSLAAEGMNVRVGVRHPERASFLNGSAGAVKSNSCMPTYGTSRRLPKR